MWREKGGKRGERDRKLQKEKGKRWKQVEGGCGLAERAGVETGGTTMR